jgi:hypothetical protein
MEEDRTTLLEQAVAKLQAERVETQNLLQQILATMQQTSQASQHQQQQESPKTVDEHQCDLEVKINYFCDYIGFRSKPSDSGHSMATQHLHGALIKGGTKWNHTKEGGTSYTNHTALVPDFRICLRGHPFITSTILL